MADYSKYFSTYESPPIKTEGYRQIERKYKQFILQEPSEQEDFLSLPFNTTKSKINDIIDLGKDFIGSKYSFGGVSPSTGFDSPGLIHYIYKQNGIDIPRTSKDIAQSGIEVPFSDIQLGDIICTSNSQVKLVSNIDNDQIYTIESKGKKYGVIESPLTDTSNITSVRRFVDNQSNSQSNNYIISYFTQKGLTKNQAKGIYGNIMQESGGNIRARSSDGHGSYGLAQWTGERKKRLFSMYGTNPTTQQQLDFLWWELNNTHKDALESLKRTSTVTDATRVFMNKFEKPHKNYAAFNRRLNYANSVT